MKAEYKNTKVAIIGLGNIGKAIATNLVKGNQAVILASRDIENSKALANELGNLTYAKHSKEAILEADVIIPAIHFHSLKDFFETYSDELDGKIIIDVSNPIAPDGNGGFKKVIGEKESAAQVLSALIPKNAKLIKAFNTLGVASLLSDAFAEPEQKVLFYSSDNTNSNSVIEQLIKNSGFEPFHVGGLDKAIQIEVFGELHQLGGLGKTVTLAEVKNKLTIS